MGAGGGPTGGYRGADSGRAGTHIVCVTAVRRLILPVSTRTPAGEVNGGHIGFQAGAFTFDLGQDVDVGIRPEDLQFCATGGGLSFLRDFTEELGATRLIHGAVGDAQLVVAVASSAATAGEGTLLADPALVHLFDSKSGASLRRGAAA